MTGIVDRHAARLEREGYCILPRAVEPAAIAELEEHLADAFAHTPMGVGPFYGERTRRFGALLRRSSVARMLALHPVVISIVEQQLLPWCDRIALNLTQAIEIHPGAPAQLPHRDQDMWPGPIITTDRRAYHLRLSSTVLATMAGLRWTYPQDEMLALRRSIAAAEASAPVASGIEVEQLNFTYTISGDQPSWRPLRAFDDGHRTYIEFPASLSQGEAPPLFSIGADGDVELVNYRLRGRFYVVDRILDRAELRFGLKKQIIVRIDRAPATRRRGA